MDLSEGSFTVCMKVERLDNVLKLSDFEKITLKPPN